MPAAGTTNQDRAVCRIGADGEWLIAVADGASGRPRGAAAARRAIRSLPERIDSPNLMRSAFEIANDAVDALVPWHLRVARAEAHRCPATMLCVAAWSPGWGPVVGIAGDTVCVLLWRTEDGVRSGRTLGQALPGVDRARWARYLGGAGVWPSRAQWTDRDPIEVLTDDRIDPPADHYTFVIVSDGAWQPLVNAVAGGEKPADPLAVALADALGPDDRTAHQIATRIMHTIKNIGLHDNATVAVACAVEE